MILSFSILSFLSLSKEVIFLISKLEKVEKIMIFLIVSSSILIIFLFNFKVKRVKRIIFFLAIFFIFFNLGIIFSSKNMFTFLMCIEISLIPICLVILESSKNSDKNNSIFFIFLFRVSGSIPFMYFCFKNRRLLKDIDSKRIFINDSSLLIIFSILILLIKIPIFTRHIWLSKAHVSSSIICSMILAGLIIKMGTFGVLKLFNFNRKNFFIKYLSAICIFSLIRFLLIGTIILRYGDMKNFIALSSVSHMRVIVFLIFLGRSLSIDSSIFIITGHGLISFCLFFVMGLIYEIRKRRSSKLNSSFERSCKRLSLIFSLFMVINLGIPPMIIFFSEFYILVSLLRINILTFIPVFICMIVPIINLIYFLCKFLFRKKINFNSSKDSIKTYVILYLYLFKTVLLKFM